MALPRKPMSKKPHTLLFSGALLVCGLGTTNCTDNVEMFDEIISTDRSIQFQSANSHFSPIHRPHLVLLVVVDQLRFDYLARFKDLYTGGFRTPFRKRRTVY